MHQKGDIKYYAMTIWCPGFVDPKLRSFVYFILRHCQCVMLYSVSSRIKWKGSGRKRCELIDILYRCLTIDNSEYKPRTLLLQNNLLSSRS
jgi:hypothetical protein